MHAAREERWLTAPPPPRSPHPRHPSRKASWPKACAFADMPPKTHANGHRPQARKTRPLRAKERCHPGDQKRQRCDHLVTHALQPGRNSLLPIPLQEFVSFHGRPSAAVGGRFRACGSSARGRSFLVPAGRLCLRRFRSSRSDPRRSAARPDSQIESSGGTPRSTPGAETPATRRGPTRRSNERCRPPRPQRHRCMSDE